MLLGCIVRAFTYLNERISALLEDVLGRLQGYG